jgi:nicotinamidase-related amidase
MASGTYSSPILVVVDVQQGMVEGSPEWGPRSTPNLIPNIEQLLSFWRSKQWHILHVQHDDVDDPENPIAAKFPETYAIHPSAAPKDSEKVFVKHTSSAFVGTELQSVIKTYEREKRKIIVIGMDGAQCVNSTTRHGVDLGLEIVVVADACATYGMDDWETGERVTAEDTHRAAMGMLAGFGKVYTTKKLLEVLEEKS